MPEQKIDIACKFCGSLEVRRDADAAWNREKQAWEVVSIYDNASCEACGGETSLMEIPLEGKP